ncbi:zinc finger protein with KRAB and SCAN domains 5-like isoform X1 [Stegodyphus dumicola]|uniref:zinc finger protein with KRAB and SCAN domains 5-like isoform X1 n=1 Tax=Stegodyphus dumicola TaxID=202533 RepID=UPI0015ABCA9C|nr:zinc finger protein with KRAB and SCAN domains 5-like isoform X1 [Stegodyphus dumicola]XP_035230479.1 zinc finger protein with KRAB and SCAN domains 5-like isoform X1 [Stegodyphus dumicola]XP_035230480.1 zinc finger protein with KRAB and SCAN domains 5-like isoform X1 [Stegodyphus dumicola]XP_035230481.1 zinc finger protein with KRAB and SCAN domains 5-like isoform X1 [Stegodyphus dumicola]
MIHSKPIVFFEIIQTEKQNIYEPKNTFVEHGPKFKNHEEATIFLKQRTERQLDKCQIQKTFGENAISVSKFDSLTTRTGPESFVGCLKESAANSEVEVKEQQDLYQPYKAFSKEHSFLELASISNLISKEENIKETKRLVAFPTRRMEWQLDTYQLQKSYGENVVSYFNLDPSTKNPGSESFLGCCKKSFENSEMKEQLNKCHPADALSGKASFDTELSPISNTIPMKEDIEGTKSLLNIRPNYAQSGIKGNHTVSKKRSARGIRKVYKCCFCYYATTRSDRLARHKVFIHSKASCYECYICKFKSTYNHEYYLHMKQHFGNSPYMCPLCNYTTRIISAFVTHRITHTNHHIFQCHQCAYKCKRKHHLTQHASAHTREAPFQCTYCEKRYKHNCSLKKHLLSHMRKT